MNYRNKKLLQLVRQMACAHCGIQDETIVAAHSNQLRDGKGRGIKAHDYRIAGLCYECHFELDQGSKLSKHQRNVMWEDAHRHTIGWLFEKGYIHV